MKKRIRALLAAAVMLFSFLLPLSVSADDEKPELTHIRAALLYNATADELMYDLNGEATLFPASFAKIMTAVLALEHYADKPDATVQITYDAVEGAKDSASADLLLGEIVPARDLIASLIVANANDSAIALAIDIAGSQKEFTARMNERAQALGMTHTHYENPTGLHNSKMVTTANDTMILIREAYRTDGFMTYASMPSYTVPMTNYSKERYLVNRNYLVSQETVTRYFDEDASGMNYGSTYEAGGCLAATILSGGSRYFAVIMGADNLNDPETGILQMFAYVDALKLFDWARENYAYTRVVTSSRIIAEIPVSFGNNADYVALLPEENIDVFLRCGEEDLVSVTWEFDKDKMTAPVAAGDRAGTLTVTYRGKTFTTALVARSTVDRSVWAYWAGEIVDFLYSAAFRKILIVFLIAAAVYILFSAIWRARMRKKSLERRRAKQEEEQRKRERQTLVVRRVPPASSPYVTKKRSAPSVRPTKGSQNGAIPDSTEGKSADMSGTAPGAATRTETAAVRRTAPYIDREPVTEQNVPKAPERTALPEGEQGGKKEKE